MTVIAQQTTGSVRGTLNTPEGEPVVGATVTVTDTRSGTSRVVRSNENGVFAARDLIVGGPYTINVSSDAYRNCYVGRFRYFLRLTYWRPLYRNR